MLRIGGGGTQKQQKPGGEPGIEDYFQEFSSYLSESIVEITLSGTFCERR